MTSARPRPSRTATSKRAGHRQRPNRTNRPPASASPAVATTGTFRAHPRGFGFADLDVPAAPQVDSAFVPPPLARGLLDGDLLTFRVQLDDRGATATRVDTTLRRRRYVCGTVERTGRSARLHFDPQLGAITVEFTAACPTSARTGDVVVVALADDVERPQVLELVAGPVAPGTPAAARFTAVVRSFGHEELSGTDETRQVTDAHLRSLLHAEPEPTCKVRRRASTQVPGAALVRTNLTGLHTVTVDGAHSRDLDDAVSASRRRDGSVQVHVHIADVAAYVADGTPLDVRARALTTSTYLADHVAPMLPPDLSERRLSLLPGVTRDTVTVAFTVARSGEVDDVSLAVSSIVSDERLTYQRVQEHQDGTRLDGPTAQTVDAMVAAADALGRSRSRRATLTQLFTAPQRDVAVTGSNLTTVDADPYADAMQVIERLMVAANEAVAGWLAERGLLALYRTHAGVDPARAKQLHAALTAHGTDPLELAADGYPAASLLNVMRSAGPQTADAIAQCATDAMGRAGYTADPQHHFGLDSLPYVHFTSPIRRYADLVVHRAVRAALAGEPPPHPRGELEQMAAWIAVRAGASARAEALERTLLWGTWLRAELKSGRRVDRLEATVRRITPAGLVVRVGEYGIGGFVPAEAATGRRGKLQVADDELSERTGRFQVGGRARVHLADVDDTGRLTLTLAS